MSSGSDVSTDDLAQPGGAREQQPIPAQGRATPETADPAAGGLEQPAGAGEQRLEGGEERVAGGDAGGGEDRLGGRDATAGGGAVGGDAGGGEMALLDSAEESTFRQRWSDVQARFVDDPQDAVHTADGLVAELMQSLARGFSEHKGRLEQQWQSGGTPDTEELRQALQRYRSFFNRLLST
jgi:hypothetical protein